MRCRPRRILLAASALALASPMMLAGGASGQVDPTADPADAVTRPAPVVIETIDPDLDPNDPELVAKVEQVRAQRRQAVMAAAQTTELPDGRAAAVSGITVSYVSDTPAQVKAVVDAAIADWNAALATSANGPVHVTFDWRDLAAEGLPGVLGYAGPTDYVLRGNNWFPVALANTIDDVDYVTSLPELEVTLASNYYNVAGGWYASVTDDNVPFDRLDLYATVLHEVGHGLGFLGSALDPDGSSGPQSASLLTPRDKYDTLVSVDGVPLLSLANPDSYLTSNNLDIAIGGTRVHKLYAPSTFFNGSSYSHFDENSYRNGAPGSLMTPALSNGEVERVLDAPTLGVLAQSGWPMDVGPVSPTITATSPAPNQITVNWGIDLGDSGTVPTDFVVQALEGSTVRQTVTVGPLATSAALTGLTNGQAYTVRVTPFTSGRAGTPAATTVTILLVPAAPSLVNVTGSGLARTVTWQAPDDNGAAITSYTVDMAKNGGAFSSLGTTTATSIPTGTLTNDVYQFRVRAINANGAGTHGYSLPVGFTNTVVRPVPLDGEIARLYGAYFDRTPDPSGMAYYINLRATGTSLTAISDAFATSPEFVNTYGPLTNQQFIEQLYLNVLGRPGDAGGIAFWTSQLDDGRTRGEIVIGFSQSSEFVIATDTAAVQTPTEGAIYRLYLAYFLRPPDAAGQDYWVSQVAGGVSLSAVSSAFTQSAEFTSRYGSLGNTEFIELVYANVLTRTPDAGGYDFWLNQMSAGLSRGDVMLSFANSAEFVTRTGTVL